MTDLLTLTLRRPERPNGVKHTTISWNGNIKKVWEGAHLKPSRRYLFEMSAEEQAERMERLRGRDGQETLAPQQAS